MSGNTLQTANEPQDFATYCLHYSEVTIPGDFRGCFINRIAESAEGFCLSGWQGFPIDSAWVEVEVRYSAIPH
jgi:hypothetical protein